MRSRDQQIPLRPLVCPCALWAGHYRQEESVMELSSTAVSLTYPPHLPNCTERHHPPYLVFLLLACQSLFLFSIHQFHFFSPQFRLFIIHNVSPPALPALSSSSVSQPEKENSAGDLGLSRNRGPETLRSVYFAQVVLQK